MLPALCSAIPHMSEAALSLLRCSTFKTDTKALETQVRVLLAEKQNIEARHIDELAIAKLDGKRSILKDLIKLCDTFEFLQASDKPTRKRLGWVPSLFSRNTDRLSSALSVQLTQLFEKHGVSKVDTTADFDSSRHEIVSTVSKSGVRDNSITSVLLPGYVHEGIVLRPAKVVVNEIYLFYSFVWSG